MLSPAPLPIVDLFAGPGGLGEGFSASGGGHYYRIALSVEMDAYAHETLELRSFTRQFGGQLPPDYVRLFGSEVTVDELYAKHPVEAEAARSHAWRAELGNPDSAPKELVKEYVERALCGRRDWVLIGGPPCQAYSLVGRSRNSGVPGYDATKDHRHFLYREYLWFLQEFQPIAFVMENVPGILSARKPDPFLAKHKWEPMFPSIRSDLQAAGYELVPVVACASSSDRKFIVKFEELGVPQRRHRVIVIGLRQDFWDEALPRLELPIYRQKGTDQEDPLLGQSFERGLIAGTNADRTSLGDAIADMGARTVSLSRSKTQWPPEDPGSLVSVREIGRYLSNRSAPVYSGIQDAEVAHTMRLVGAALSGKSKTSAPDWAADSRLPPPLKDWYKATVGKEHEIRNHEPRRHRADDIVRYVFAAAYARRHGRSPKIADFPAVLLPDHRNVRAARKSPVPFADRFRVQLADQPATTVTSHIAKDGHYYIHPDPYQCRSLTVREAARIQTFPDDYLFRGPRTEQYKQVGNAVPPYAAYQIANALARVLGLQD